jgi:hypothetical protein
VSKVEIEVEGRRQTIFISPHLCATQGHWPWFLYPWLVWPGSPPRGSCDCPYSSDVRFSAPVSENFFLKNHVYLFFLLPSEERSQKAVFRIREVFIPTSKKTCYLMASWEPLQKRARFGAGSKYHKSGTLILTLNRGLDLNSAKHRDPEPDSENLSLQDPE